MAILSCFLVILKLGVRVGARTNKNTNTTETQASTCLCPNWTCCVMFLHLYHVLFSTVFTLRKSSPTFVLDWYHCWSFFMRVMVRLPGEFVLDLRCGSSTPHQGWDWELANKGPARILDLENVSYLDSWISTPNLCFLNLLLISLCLIHIGTDYSPKVMVFSCFLILRRNGLVNVFWNPYNMQPIQWIITYLHTKSFPNT